MKKQFLRILILAPSLILLVLAYLFPIENTHYGFINPGVDFDATILVAVFAFLSLFFSLLSVFIKNKQKFDLALVALAQILAAVRLLEIILIFNKYYN